MTANEYIGELESSINKSLIDEGVQVKLEPTISFKVFPYVDVNKEIIYIPLQSINYLWLYNEVLSQKKYKGDVVKDLYFLQQSLDLRNVGMLEFYGNKYLKDLDLFINKYRDSFNINHTKESDFEHQYQFYFSLFHEIGHIIIKKNPSIMEGFNNIANIPISLGSKISTIIPIWEAKRLVADLNYLEEIICDTSAFVLLMKYYKQSLPYGNITTMLNIISRMIWMADLETNNYKYLGVPKELVKGYESVLISTSLRLVFLEYLNTGHYRIKIRLKKIPPAFNITTENNECFMDNQCSGFILDYDHDEMSKVIEMLAEQEYNLFDQI